MRVALAQIDTVVGDIQGNTMRALRAIGDAEAAGAGVTLLPELCLTGYPPEDLLARPHFVEENLDALEAVAAAAGNAAVIGFVDRDPDGTLYNAAALIGNARILRVYRKRRLPNYGVFDERRYFAPGDSDGLFELGGTMFDLTVCEDVWTPEVVAEDVALGASVVFNISASPFHAGKGAQREAMLAQRARDNNVWLAYCNLVGGQDELVFDGRSVVISPTGQVVARAKAFEEDLILCRFRCDEPAGRAGTRGTAARRAKKRCIAPWRSGCPTTLRKNGFTDVVIGLSGGIDSALTATLAVDALGAGHVHGVLHAFAVLVGGQRHRRAPRWPRTSASDDDAAYRGAVLGLPGHAAAGVRGPRARRDRGEPPGPRARDAPHGAVQQVRLARARDRQQVGALGRLLHALRRHGGRLRAHQRPAQDARVRPGALAQRACAWRARHPGGDDRRSRPRPSCEPGQTDRTRCPPTRCSTASCCATWSET